MTQIPVRKTHRIDLLPTGKGRALMFYQGIKIGSSSEPLFSAARLLLSKGLAWTEDRIETYRDGMPCLSALTRDAARMRVRERDTGELYIDKWRSFTPGAIPESGKTKKSSNRVLETLMSP